MLNTLMHLHHGLIIIIGDHPILLIEINLNLMGGHQVHDLAKNAIIHRLEEYDSSLAIEM
jgi:hypothetical protein